MALGGADNLARSPELRTKLLWTLGLLCAYRIGVHIPVPGVDGGALAPVSYTHLTLPTT